MSNTVEGTSGERLPAYEIRQQNISMINDLLIRAEELGYVQTFNGAMQFDVPFTKERDKVERELKGVKPASFLTTLRIKKHGIEDMAGIRYSLTYTDTAMHDGTRYYMGKSELQFREPDKPIRRRIERSSGSGIGSAIDSLSSEDENELGYDLALAGKRLEQIVASRQAGAMAIRQAA